jgi:hypothetical protein
MQSVQNLLAKEELIMLRRIITYITYPVLIAGIVLCLAGIVQAATGNIDPTDKWTWGTNVGWINFSPTHGGVTVYADHLEGYAWGENIGWIRMGTHTSGGTHTYANTTKDNYGVNRDASGNLSGYAWGTNVGWISFNPSHSQVTVDPDTGSFDGYAWSESVGWIHFKSTGSVEYGVVTSFRGGGGGGGDIYLPLVAKSYTAPVYAPDLVVDNLVATSSVVTVTIRNAGTVAVTDAFWVDVYFNPSQTPSLNHPWDTIASHGATWGVTADIPAGGSLVLTTGGDYYFPEYSSTPPLPVGADVYALVDSVDYSTTYGAVRESDEDNNLFGPVTSTAGVAGQVAPVVGQGQPASLEELPPR